MPIKKNNEEMKRAIQLVIENLMNRVMRKVLIDDPFIKEEFKSKTPIYAALVPEEIFKGSHFERRFVTPFGGIWEELAVAAATNGLGYGERNKVIIGNVRKGRLQRISEVLNNLEHPQINSRNRIHPDWNKEIDYILKGNGPNIPTQVNCDVYAADIKNNTRFVFEVKAPMPNSDQTKVSKEKLLKLYSMDPPQIDGAYFALPYNPYGNKEDYDWRFPFRWFDMKNDSVVLIGIEFWEKIGGKGTYLSFINAINEVGPIYKDRIYREYLGIFPTNNMTNDNLK